MHDRIQLFEQPTKKDEDDALRFVCERSAIPVFADESAHRTRDAGELIRATGCKGVVLKLAKTGIRGTVKMALSARDAGRRLHDGLP